MFTQLFQEHATGMVVLRDSDQTIEKRIAISFGQPIANTSSLLDESFGSFLTQRNILSVAEAKELRPVSCEARFIAERYTAARRVYRC